MMRLHSALSLGGILLIFSLVATPVAAQQAASPPKPLDLDTYRNRAFDAYTQALADGKYTMLLFSKIHEVNGFARQMEKNLKDPYLSVYSAYYVAALIDEKHDQGGAKLAAALDIQRYPTVIVLKTDPDRLHVVGRIEGVFDAKAIDQVFRESLQPIEPVKTDASQGKSIP